MAILVFKADEVRRCIEHARKSTKFQREITGYDEKKHEFLYGPDDRPCLLLVHDQGVYLMSGGDPGDIVEGETRFVAYAEGCDPRVDADWYDTALDLVGGDDFGEHLGDGFISGIEAVIESGKPTVRLALTKQHIKIKS